MRGRTSSGVIDLYKVFLKLNLKMWALTSKHGQSHPGQYSDCFAFVFKRDHAVGKAGWAKGMEVRDGR